MKHSINALFRLLLLFMHMLMLMQMPPKNTLTKRCNSSETHLSSESGSTKFGNDFNEFSPWLTWRARYHTDYLTTARWKLCSIVFKAEAGFQNYGGRYA